MSFASHSLITDIYNRRLITFYDEEISDCLRLSLCLSSLPPILTSSPSSAASLSTFLSLFLESILSSLSLSVVVGSVGTSYASIVRGMRAYRDHSCEPRMSMTRPGGSCVRTVCESVGSSSSNDFNACRHRRRRRRR